MRSNERQLRATEFDGVWLSRARVAAAFDQGNDTGVVGVDGRLHLFSSDDAKVVRMVLQLLERPKTYQEILRAARECSYKSPTVQKTLATLVEGGIVLRTGPPPESPTEDARQRVSTTPRLCLGLSGAVASALAPVLIQQLLDGGFAVRVITSANATRFVSPLAIEALTHHPVFSSMWQQGDQVRIAHIDFCRWADLVVVWPASATTVARIANGDCSDLVSAVAIATKSPVVVAPSMNGQMWESPSVRRNVARLRDDGYYVIHGGLGYELADRPDDRKLEYGPSPPVEIVSGIVKFIWQRHLAQTA